MACVALSLGEGLKRLHKAALTYLPFFFAAFLAAFFAVFLVALAFFAGAAFTFFAAGFLVAFLALFLVAMVMLFLSFVYDSHWLRGSTDITAFQN
jgi:hypothetical protein